MDFATVQSKSSNFQYFFIYKKDFKKAWLTLFLLKTTLRLVDFSRSQGVQHNSVQVFRKIDAYTKSAHGNLHIFWEKSILRLLSNTKTEGAISGKHWSTWENSIVNWVEHTFSHISIAGKQLPMQHSFFKCKQQGQKIFSTDI